MKKIKLIFTSFAIMALALACEKDGGESKIEFAEGGVPNVKKITTTDTSINLVAINNNVPINLGLTFNVARGNVSSMDVVGIYRKGTVVEKAIIKANISGFPATVNINQTDLINAFNILNTKADFSITDKLTISADVILSDGRRLNMFNNDGTKGYAADINNSLQFSVSQDYTVSCPLNDASLFNGNYKVTVDDWQDYSIGATVPVVYNSTNGLLKFRVLNTNNPSSLPSSSASYFDVTINPATSTVSLVSNGNYVYGAGAGNSFTATGTGNVASCTGDINLKVAWKNGLNSDFGIFNFNLTKI